MPLLYTIAITAAAKLGYKLAEHQKWLPGPLYRQIALDKLKAGDLESASHFSDIALQKNPDDDKASLVQEIVAMRRDADKALLLKQLENELLALPVLQTEKEHAVQKRFRLQWATRLEITLAWLLFGITVISYIIVYFLFTKNDFYITASIVGGVAVMTTIASIYLFRKLPDRRQQRTLDRMELLAGERSMSKEIEMRQNRIALLKAQLDATK